VKKSLLQQDSFKAIHLRKREGDAWHCYLHSLPARLTVSFVPQQPKAALSNYLQPQLAINTPVEKKKGFLSLQPLHSLLPFHKYDSRKAALNVPAVLIAARNCQYKSTWSRE